MKDENSFLNTKLLIENTNAYDENKFSIKDLLNLGIDDLKDKQFKLNLGGNSSKSLDEDAISDRFYQIKAMPIDIDD